MKDMRGAKLLVQYFIILLIIFTVIVVPGIIVKTIIPSKGERPPGAREDPARSPAPETVAVYLNSAKKIEEMPLEEYVKGVVAAEMPASFEKEALKAQAVAARTYVYKRWQRAGGSGCSLHPEADVCDDSTHCQAMLTKAQMLKKWGLFSYHHYLSKVKQAVNSTAGMVLFYEDTPIDPLYFSTSNGKTENSEDVWDKALPYLRSVTSPGEEISPRFLMVKEFPVEEVALKLKQKWPQVTMDPEDPTKVWKVVERSTGGRIKTLDIGGVTVKGTEIRSLFELNSTDIQWERSKNRVKFTCKGFGHGVGMSQYGANAMAKTGANYVDILKHYYTGVEVKKIPK